ncbi:hypothetical protein M422DRAFT_112480, partial [Sphaerobolus stellatus SS14]
ELKTKILQWLSAPNYSAHYREALGKREDNTGFWFLGSERFKYWRESTSSYLWLYGIPGCGKTVLSASIVEELHKFCLGKGSSYALAYFFFDARDGSEDCGFDKFLRSIVIGKIQRNVSGFNLLLSINIYISYRFRWVALQLDELKDCYSQQNVREQLDELPNNLEETYQRILVKINKKSRGDAQKLLVWLSFAFYSFTLEELAEVVCISTNSEKAEFSDARRIKPEVVLSICGGLVTQSNAASFGTNAKLAHSMIARTCLVYLRHFSTQFNLVLDWNRVAQKVAPLFYYAQLYWADHTYRAEDLLEEDSTITLVTTTPLYFATYWEFTHVVQELIRKGADVNAANPPFGPALAEAAASGHQKILTLLLEAGADVNAEDNTQLGGALSRAASYGFTEIVKILLERGAETTGIAGANALTTACLEGGHLNIIKLLLDRGAEVNIVGGDSGTALQAAVWNKHTDVLVKLLLEYGADVDAQGGFFGDAFHAACHYGDMEVIKCLLEAGADIQAECGTYGTALQAASLPGHTEVIKFLLDQQVPINAQKSGGKYGNALQAAAFGGHTEIVRTLLKNGASPNREGLLLANPLYAAASRGHLEAVRLLLQYGADPNIHGGYYDTPLQAACAHGYTEIAEILLQKDAKAQPEDGGIYGNPFYAAITVESGRVVELLLDAGVNVNAQGGFFGTALQAASAYGYAAIVGLLLDRGA